MYDMVHFEQNKKYQYTIYKKITTSRRIHRTMSDAPLGRMHQHKRRIVVWSTSLKETLQNMNTPSQELFHFYDKNHGGEHIQR